MSNEIMVFVELQGGEISNTSKSAFTVAQSLADSKGWNVSALIAGSGVDAKVKECSQYGASKTYYYDHQELKNYRSLPFTRIMLQCIKENSPEVIIFGYSTTSTDFAPRVSTSTGVGLLTGATEVTWDGENISVKRPIYKDKLYQKFLLKGNPKMIILGPGSFAAIKPDINKSGEIISCEAKFEEGDLIETVVSTETVKRSVDLSEAKLIISGGRGVGSKEKFSVIFESAESLGGQVASSRAVWDAGWTESDIHVGQTGGAVSPGAA